MIEVYKRIFGKKYRIVAHEGFEQLTAESVDVYPDWKEGNSDVDVFVGTTFDNSERLISANPAIFSRYERSFATDFGKLSVRWRVSNESQFPRLTAYLSFHKSSSLRLGFYARFRSMEYSTELEVFEQLFHELFLVPSTYFFADLVPIHAASISISGHGVLLAGTGGTGKTSALLTFRHKEEISFLSDDIAILSLNGNVYPNFAWPKVYGYNMVDLPHLKSLVFSNRGAMDRLHFIIRARTNPSKVRRKIRPETLYSNVEREGCKLTTVYYLFRENIPELSLQELAIDRAVEMSIAVMETEYSIFHKYLNWEMFNTLCTGHLPLLTLNEVIKNWRFNLRVIFENLSLKLVRIPIDMSHQVYIKEIEAVIQDRR